MATRRASARPSASSRRTWGPPPAASSETLLGELKQWSKACTRSLTRLPRCCQAPANASPYSERGSVPSTLRQRRSTVSTLTRLAPRRRGPGGQFGRGAGPPQRRTALLAGGRVQALEHRPHLLGAGGPLQAGRGRGAAHEPAWRLTASGEVLFAVAGDLVQPVALLACLQRLHRQGHQRDPPAHASGQLCIADADV